jgi:hypothetical protein
MVTSLFFYNEVFGKKGFSEQCRKLPHFIENSIEILGVVTKLKINRLIP